MARRLARDRRRAFLAATAAVGATALFAPGAQAADFTVTTDSDSAMGSLRDAITSANAAPNSSPTTPDTISFDTSAFADDTITLTAGQIPITESVTITGPGQSAVKVSGNDASRIFDVTGLNTSTTVVSVSALTLMHGHAVGSAAAGAGGAIRTDQYSDLTLTDAAVSSNAADTSGGGIQAVGPLTVTNSTLSGNTATDGAGGAINYAADNANLKIAGSAFSGNHAHSNGGAVNAGGGSVVTGTTFTSNEAQGGVGGAISSFGALTLTGSSLTGNTASLSGGGVYAGTDYGGLVAEGSTISGNTATSALGGGGGVAVNEGSGKYAARNRLSHTVVSGNHATGGDGGGVLVGGLGADDRMNVVQSTISGNDAGSSGGGISFRGNSPASLKGELALTDATVSGNTAATGGGVGVGTPHENPVLGPHGTIAFDNSTIAANSATSAGGGIFFAQYDSTDAAPVKKSATVAATSTIVGDNLLNGSGQDADRIDSSTSGGLDLAFSLVENPSGDSIAAQSADRPSITGSDPLLGPLTDNGGQTLTQLPSLASPAIDQGFAPARPGIDQRGLNRTVDGTGIDNAPRGDGSDIGSVEVQNPPAKPPVPPLDKRPVATITANHLTAKKAKKRVVRGRASDDHGVGGVQVAIVRKKGGRCASVKASGRFGKAGSCTKLPKFLTAAGAARWGFRLKRKLAPGNYVVYARAIDDQGQKQTSFGAASIDPFRVG